MAGAANVMIKIGANAGNAIGEIGKVNKALGDQMSASQKASLAIRKAAVPAGLALAAMGAAAYDAVQKAGDLAETQSKVGVIFGDASKEIEKWSKNAPKALGQTQQAALDAASTMATFGKAAGLTGKDLVAFSTDLTGLSSDLASFYNTDPAAAAEAIGAALRGEAEPIRKYGILLNDATLKSEALKLGLIKTTKDALTPQTKALAAQAAIMRQSADAQGDFARTADGAANQQRILKAQIEQLQTELGTALLPAFQAIVGQLASFAGIVSQNQSTVKVLVVAIAGLAAAVVGVNAAMSAFQAISAIVKASTVAWTVAQWALNVAMTANPIGIVVVAIAALVAGLILAYKNSETFRNIVDTAFAAIKSGTQTALRPFIENWDTISKVIDTAIGYLRRFWPLLLPGGVFWLALKEAQDRFGLLTTAVEVAKTAFDIIKTAVEAYITVLRVLFTVAGNVIEKLASGVLTALTPFKTAIEAITTAVKELIGYLSKVKLPSINLPFGRSGTLTTSYLGNTAAASSTTVNVTINGPIDADSTAREILSILNQYDTRYAIA